MKNHNNHTRKEVIKVAARNLFFQFGLAKTSMDDIAAQSNLAKPSLYYYYPKKEAIFQEIVIEEVEKFINKVEKNLPQDLPADEKIACFFRMIYQDLKLYLKEIKKIPSNLYQNYPHGKPMVDKINDVFLEKLIPLIKIGQAQGVLDFEDETSTLNALVFMTDFLNLDWMLRIPEKKRDEIVEAVIRIILNGLRRR
jgi:AcrR family transcriptional regulator